ncbi:MAG: hypothetical protein JWP96_660 [Polaromonas sp.]|nr:hypothetical protein [Polaromonas sp.]
MNPTTSPHHHYNPDWLSDDALVGNFVARLDEFNFLRDELVRAPREGSAQHYLLVGVRGAGKTTLLKRLAVAIRRDKNLRDHLIALSFPEELYQVKNLSDFWWAACEALVDELDRLNQTGVADRLMAAIAQAKKGGANADPLSDAGFQCLQQHAADLGLRPVLLVDNLDLVFQRIDKSGRKLKDPHAPAYWALREALSTTTSPIVIGGSVRLSEPFTDYDKAFYDFFIPKRLGKLSLVEVRQVLDRLADAQGMPEVKQRLQQRPSRIEALYELTGGNPRALGLIFELLRQGPNSRAVEDFERLMDITTPYYKARFEELSEQAQVVMHALAVCRPDDAGGLRFGLTAAEIGLQAGLPTGTVSAQLDTLEREGLAEKSAAHGKTQYRIAEQLFRLWLQMRGNRRIRQNVMGLTQFLEAMFSVEELQAGLQEQHGVGPLADARLTFATADTRAAQSMRRGLEAKGADHLLQHIATNGGDLEDFLHAGDLPEDLQAIIRLREQLQKCASSLSVEEQNALIGSVEMSLKQKQAHVQALCQPVTAQEAAARLRAALARERQNLLRYGLLETDLPLLFRHRARGCLPLPLLTPQDAESDAACLGAHEAQAFRSMVWRLVGTRKFIQFSDDAANAWLDWGQQHASGSNATEWANVTGSMRHSGRLVPAKKALEHAFSLGETSRVWLDHAALLEVSGGDVLEVELAYRKAIELDPMDAPPWINLGILLSLKLKRYEEAEAAYRKAIELDPGDFLPWNNLGNLLIQYLNRSEEAEILYRKAIELDPENGLLWSNLGSFLSNKFMHYDEAEAAYRKAIELHPLDSRIWNNLGALLTNNLTRSDEAEAAIRKAIELDPTNAQPWHNLGNLLEKQGRLVEASAAYATGASLDSNLHPYWQERRVNLQTRLCTDAARQALETDNLPALHAVLGQLLAESVDLASALVSKPFIEDFLAKVLAQGQQAAAVLDALRDLGYAKHARPLLLAFEAVMKNRPDMLGELEPEVQHAARLMFDRLNM